MQIATLDEKFNLMGILCKLNEMLTMQGLLNNACEGRLEIVQVRLYSVISNNISKTQDALFQVMTKVCKIKTQQISSMLSIHEIAVRGMQVYFFGVFLTQI